MPILRQKGPRFSIYMHYTYEKNNYSTFVKQTSHGAYECTQLSTLLKLQSCSIETWKLGTVSS